MELSAWMTAKREELKRLRVDVRNVTPSIRDFTSAVGSQRPSLGVVVEIARSTPEEGPLVDGLDVKHLAQVCDACDVAAIAVATDALSCGGSPADLASAAAGASVPVLQRDLILAREQLYQARQCQADASVLLAEALQPGELKLFIDLASSTHLATPVEVRSAEELQTATAAGARIVVIPAFEGGRLSLALADALLPKVPRTSTVIVRGPFASPDELAPLRGRADAVWTCGPFMRAADPRAFLKPLVEAAENG